MFSVSVYKQEKKLLQVFFLFMSLFIQYQGTLRGQQSQITMEIAKIIRYEANIDFNTVPGILVGVQDGDSTYICSFGEKINEGDIYEMGSLTKPFIAWLANQALDSLGKSTETTICTFLPDSLCRIGWEDITVDQLLKHQSGLVRFPPDIRETPSSIVDPYNDYDVGHLSKDITRLKPVAGQYSYSHIGYALLYWLFEKVGGLESFTQRRLHNTSALDCTGWSFPDDKIAQGHGFDGRLQSPWHFKAMAPALGWRSCMDGLLAFLDLISPTLAMKTPLLTSVLKKEFKALAKADAYMVVDGWFLIQSGSDLIYYHTGRTGGHQVSVALIPQTRKAVVVISNGALGSNELSLLVLNMVNHSKAKN